MAETAKISGGTITKLTRNNTIMGITTVVALMFAVLSLRANVAEHHTVVSVNSRGIMTPVVPLDNPVLPDSRIIAFSEECLRKAFSHDFLHYATTIAEAQDCFTPSASDLYVQGMDGYLTTIKTKTMVMAMTATRPSRITRFYTKPTGYGANTVAWDVSADLSIYFEGKNERIPPTRYRVNLTVIRAPFDVTPKGVQIEKFEVGPFTGPN
jgi:hypothetical protein